MSCQNHFFDHVVNAKLCWRSQRQGFGVNEKFVSWYDVIAVHSNTVIRTRDLNKKGGGDDVLHIP